MALGLLEDNPLGVSLNAGRGNFSHVVATQGPQAIIFLAMADLNGDRKLDAIFTGLSTRLLEVVLGVGDHSFKNTQPVKVEERSVAAVVGHFGATKLPDIAFATASGIGIGVR